MRGAGGGGSGRSALRAHALWDVLAGKRGERERDAEARVERVRVDEEGTPAQCDKHKLDHDVVDLRCFEYCHSNGRERHG
eukprot:scaffold10590_cov81-Isochrysis_galbana.AAC.1